MASSAVLLVILQECVRAAYVEVRTSAGVIRGIESDGILSFLGIPFAQPPIGHLRFASPMPLQGWSGVRNATKLPSSCMIWSSTGTYTGSEDCLYLNVAAPAKAPGNLRPVIVKIHGGSFVAGYAGQSTALTKATNVVVFRIQYRLGMFGFLATQSPPPNFGIQDQRMALRWVQQNAEAFGGDAAQVMIHGCSAGGASVAGHLVLPESFGLYSSASIASPGGHQGWMTDEQRMNDDWILPSLARNHFHQVLQELSCSRSSANETLACLRRAPVEALHPLDVRLRFAPSLAVDGQYPLSMIQHGEWNPVPTMIGGANCEGCLDAGHSLGYMHLWGVSEAKFEQALIGYGLGEVNGSGVSLETLERWYQEQIASEGRWNTFARICGDAGHSCSTALHAEALAKSSLRTGSSPGVWRYFMEIPFDGLGGIPWMPGTVHCEEAWYLEHDAVDWYSPNQQKLEYAEDLMAQSLANLAAHGDPNTGSSKYPHWSKFGNDSPDTLIVNLQGATMGSNVETVRPVCNHWKPYLGWGEDVTQNGTAALIFM